MENGKVVGLIMLLLSLNSCSQIFPSLTWPQAESRRDRAKTGSREPASFISRLQARQAKAAALMAQSDLAAALVQWQILHALDPENATFNQQRRTTQALIDQRVQTHLQVGIEAFKRGRIKRAKQAFLRALALDPSQPLPPTYLRQIEQRRLERLQRHQLARAQARAAETSDAYDHPELEGVDYFERGLQYFYQKECEASIEALRVYLVDHPQSHKGKQALAQAHFQLGRQLHRQGNLTDALARDSDLAPTSLISSSSWFLFSAKMW